MNLNIKALLKKTPILGAYNTLHILYRFKLVNAWARGIRRYGIRSRGTIGYTPDSIGHYSLMTRIMLMNRYSHAPLGDVPDLSVYWAYGAGNKEPSMGWRPLVNERCRDISKTRVDELHQQVFGYHLSIDPLTYTGPAFVKADENGIHDGHIEQLPLHAVMPGMVYQRIIANDMPDGTRQDIRIPVVGKSIPFVYLVYRELNETIGDRVMGKTELCATQDVISRIEIDAILRMCAIMGLDFGELDALRDQESDKLYIVDVNRAVGISVVPREMVSERDYWKQLTTLADLFDATFFVPALEGRRKR